PPPRAPTAGRPTGRTWGGVRHQPCREHFLRIPRGKRCCPWATSTEGIPPTSSAGGGLGHGLAGEPQGDVGQVTQRAPTVSGAGGDGQSGEQTAEHTPG